MRVETTIGTSICLPIPEGKTDCTVTLNPPAQWSKTHLEGGTCGVRLQIWEPGSFDVLVSCQAQKISHQVVIPAPAAIGEELRLQMPPWLDVAPSYGLWSAGLFGILALLVLAGYLLWRYFRPKGSSSPLETKPVWEPDVYARELQTISRQYAEAKISARDAAFMFTRLMFTVWEHAPHESEKAQHRATYEASCIELELLKFHPDYRGDAQGLVRLLDQAQRSLTRSKQPEAPCI